MRRISRLTVALISTVFLAGTVAQGQTMDSLNKHKIKNCFTIFTKRYSDDIVYPCDKVKIDTVIKRNKIYLVTTSDSTGKIMSKKYSYRNKTILYYTDGKIKSIKKDPILRSKKQGKIYIYWEDNGQRHRYFMRPRKERNDN